MEKHNKLDSRLKSKVGKLKSYKQFRLYDFLVKSGILPENCS